MTLSINEELDLLAEAVHASVSLDDTDGRVLGYSVQTQDADPARVAAILTRQVPAEVSEWQRNYGVHRATGPIHLPADPEHGMAARLCVPVRNARRTVALLWVLESTRELSPDETQIAVRSAAWLAEHLATDETPAEKMTPGVLLRRLARGERLSENQSITSIEPELLSVTVVAPAQAGSARWSERRKVERVLTAFVGSNRACVAAYAEPDHAAVLYVTGRVDAVAGLRRCAADEAVTGTASAAGVFEALNRARSAARWAAADPALPRDSTWADVGLHALASALPSTVDRALDPLLDHRMSGPMLLLTLEAYLDLAGDAQRTADALHLHRTTLYYRLGRAAEILGLDLADGLTRTRLHLELKQRRLSGT